MNVSKWSNVQVAIQSALSVDKVITGITKASPGVVTSAAHGLANGDYILLDILGMWQLDERVVRVANITTDTFELEDEDTTNFDTFASGTAKAITFGTTMTTATGLTANGGDFDFIDITTIHDNIKKQIPGIANPVSYQFENLWDAADAALIALKEASDNQSQRAIRFRFANSQTVVFSGYVGATLIPVGNALDKVTTPVTISAFGRPSLYTS